MTNINLKSINSIAVFAQNTFELIQRVDQGT